MEISVCMIVKNEEKVLKNCLECVKQFADEIIIVDTGSTDKTKEIADKYTKNVFDFEWNDNFSTARNFSFSKATKDYIMWLDADDIIKNSEIKKINALKSKIPADTYMLRYAISFDKKNNETFSYYRERILRNCNLAKWHEFIHEVVIPFGKIEYLDITIEHHKKDFSNPKRNLIIYQKHIKNGEKLSARSQYYYAKELFYNGYYRKCVVELKKYLKMKNKFEPNVADSYLTLSKCCKLLNNNAKALKLLLTSLIEISPNSEILCEIGDIFVTQKNYKQAIFFYECATLVKADIKSGQFVDKNYYYLFPYLQLTMLYYKIGDFENAKKYHLLSKSCNPNNPSVLFNEKFFNKT